MPRTTLSDKDWEKLKHVLKDSGRRIRTIKAISYTSQK